MRAHRIGAIFYVLWGLLHVAGGVAILAAARRGPREALAVLASETAPDRLPPVEGEILAGVLGYYGYLIAIVGAAALAIAVTSNWRNGRIGYWANLGLVGAVDLGLLGLLLVPGIVPWSDGLWGLSLFFLAALFSTVGRRST